MFEICSYGVIYTVVMYIHVDKSAPGYSSNMSRARSVSLELRPHGRPHHRHSPWHSVWNFRRQPLTSRNPTLSVLHLAYLGLSRPKKRVLLDWKLMLVLTYHVESTIGIRIIPIIYTLWYRCGIDMMCIARKYVRDRILDSFSIAIN